MSFAYLALGWVKSMSTPARVSSASRTLAATRTVQPPASPRRATTRKRIVGRAKLVSPMFATPRSEGGLSCPPVFFFVATGFGEPTV